MSVSLHQEGGETYYQGRHMPPWGINHRGDSIVKGIEEGR